MIVWGLGHKNFNEIPKFQEFDLIINLENYGNGWEPNLSEVKTKKILWSIDAHVKGEKPYLDEFNRGKYNILLHSTKDFVNQPFKIWFPNAFDDDLIQKREVTIRCDVGFCGNFVNRHELINKLSQKYNFIHDNFVIGDNMVNSINSYKVHWNKNMSSDINYRNFETIGCGVPLVTNYNYQYDELGFKHMDNVMFYSNDEEMFNSIDILLKDINFREKIAINGLELSKRHTYLERCKKILQLYLSISNN